MGQRGRVIVLLVVQAEPRGILQRIDVLDEARVSEVRIIPRCGSRETHNNEVRHCSRVVAAS